MLSKERENLGPAVNSLLLPIGGSVVVEEAVAGAIVAMEFVVLAVLLQLFLVLVDLLRRRALIIVAEQAEQRAGQVFRQIDRSDGALRSELVRILDDAAAPEIDASIEATLYPTGREIRVSATRARAKDPHLAVARRQGSQELHARFEVSHDAVVGHTACAAHGRCDVVRRAVAGSAEEVRTNGGVAVLRESAGELPVKLVPARHVVDHHNAGVRTRPEGPSKIGVHRVPVISTNGRRIRDHAFVGAGIQLVPSRHRCSFLVRPSRGLYLFVQGQYYPEHPSQRKGREHIRTVGEGNLMTITTRRIRTYPAQSGGAVGPSIKREPGAVVDCIEVPQDLSHTRQVDFDHEAASQVMEGHPMSARLLAFTTCLLTLAFSPGLAAAQDIAAIQELAERLLAQRSPGGTEPSTARLLPGHLPEGLTFDVPVLPGGRLVGSAAQVQGSRLVGTQIIFDAPGELWEVHRAYEAALATQGWSTPSSGGMSFGGGGFQQTPSLGNMYCRDSTETYLTMQIAPLRAGVADVRIAAYDSSATGLGRAGLCAQQGYNMGAPYRKELLPPLTPPEGARLTQTGQTGGMGGWGSDALVEADLRARLLESHFADQLVAAGWQRRGDGGEGPSAWSVWSIPDDPDWTGTLFVLELPAQNRLSVSLRSFSTSGSMSPVPTNILINP